MDIRNDLILHIASPLPDLFHDINAMAKALADIEKAVMAETADPATEEGRALIKSLAYKVSRSKTALEDVGKPLADAARLDYDKINSIRKTAKEFLDALRDDIRKPVNDWEEVEKQRVNAHSDALYIFEAQMLSIADLGPDMIRADIETIRQKSIGVEWEEFQDAAVEAKARAMAHLETILAEAEKAAAAAAELEALRAEKLEREAVELERAREAAIAERERVAAENARRAEKTKADKALEAERDKSEREHREAEQRVAAAQRERDEAAANERKRIEAFEAEKNAAREKRERDDDNRAHVFGMATDALVAAPVKIKHPDAVRVVAAISDKLIPHLSMNF